MRTGREKVVRRGGWSGRINRQTRTMMGDRGFLDRMLPLASEVIVCCNASLLSIIAITIVSDTSPPSTLAMTTPYGRCGQLQSLSFMSISAEMLHFPIDA